VLKSGGKVHGKVGIALGLTYREMQTLRTSQTAMHIDLSDLGPEWTDRVLLLFAAQNDATLAATVKESSPLVPIVDQRRQA
jgi:hypothetical protein